MPVKSLTRALVIIIGMSGQYSLATDELLEGYTWQNRLLLVFAPDADDPRLQAQNEILTTVESDLLERDLAILRLLPDSPVTIDKLPLEGSEAAAIYRDFAIDRRAFAVLLIGKDGGVKLNSDTAVSANTIFDLIDSMPMRQWEMQNQASSNLQE